MFYPSQQLVGSAAVVLLLASLVYALVPGLGLLLVAGVLVFVLLVILDVNQSVRNLEGIVAKAPERFSISVGREDSLRLQLVFDRSEVRDYWLGVAVPETIRCETPEFTIRTVGGERKLVVGIPLRGVKRGKRWLEWIHIGCVSGRGFWRIKGALPVKCLIKVFPNILVEQKSLGALFLRPGMIGSHAARTLGKGKDFEKLREYVPGDSFEDIHWKATAKRNKPITKLFQLERTQDIYVVIDASRMSARPCHLGGEDSETLTYLEKNLAVGLMLATVAERMGDRFGFFSYSDRVDGFLRASSGRQHFDACREALYCLEPSRATPDFRELLTSMCLRLRHRSLLVLLVALDDALLGERFLENVEILRRQHLVVVVSVRPPSARPLFENQAVSDPDELFEELNGHEHWQQLNRLRRQLKSRGVDMLLPDVETVGVSVVDQYLTIKRKQRL